MISSILLFLYQVAMTIAVLPIALYLSFITPDNHFNAFRERMGFASPSVQRASPATQDERGGGEKQNQITVWFHAASVGEVNLLGPLVKELRKQKEKPHIIVTTSTATGRAAALKSINPDTISYQTIDWCGALIPWFMRAKPTSIVIAEAEYWPCLLMCARWFGVPCHLVNARIREKSFDKYKRFSWWYTPLMKSFASIQCQSKADRDRFLALGVEPERVKVLGNIKLPAVVQRQKERKLAAATPTKTTLLVGSIHPGELDTYIELANAMKEEKNDTSLILAPRHLTWREELESKLKAANLSYRVIDSFGDQKPTAVITQAANEVDVVVVWAMGVLFDMYQLADVFYLGGTFIPLGGHNLAEPLVWGKPSIVGPHNDNSIELRKQVAPLGAVRVAADATELILQTKEMLAHNRDAGLRGQAWLFEEAERIGEGLQEMVRELAGG